MRYYISDLHFFHENLNTKMDKRGFESVEAMNEYMIFAVLLCGTAIDVIFPAYFGITHSFFSVVSYAQPFISNHSYSSIKLILVYWRLIVHFLSVIFVHFITVINSIKEQMERI